jgi:ubiquinone biosynthesis protein
MGFFSIFSSGRKSNFRRYNQIIRVLFRYGFEDLVSYLEEQKRFKFLRTLIPRSTYRSATMLTKWEKMRLVCEDLGPSFVKFGQILSSRSDLLPEPLIKELEKLQDNVPPIPGERAIDVIEFELQGKIPDLFAWFETEAFASASMAQVHKAILKTGERVVLKVQRPGIKELIEADIRVMLYVAEVFSKRIPSLRSFDPVGLVRNFEESIMRELDFVHESVNVQRFHINFTADKNNEGHIYSPRVFQDFTTGKVLAMEYIEGVKISDLPKLEKEGFDRKVLAKRLAISYFRQIFDYGFFHADPHPGNLLVLPGNRICFLDFGMMGNIIKKDIEQFGTLFLAVQAKDVRKIIRALQSLSDSPVIKNFRPLEADLNEFVHNHSVRSIHKNEMSSVLMELRDIVIKHGLKVPSHFFLLARSLVTVEGVIHSLDPQLDLSRMAKPYMIEAMAKRYDPLKFSKHLFNSIYEMGIYMEEFPRDLKNAIRKINSGEMKVDLHHKGVDPLVHTINRVSKQIVSGLIITGLVVGSALLIIYQAGPLWGRTSAFGIVGLIIAAVMASGLLRDISKGDHDDWDGWQEE